MTEQCEHKTAEVLARWARPKLSIEACTWGCNQVLVSVTDDNGISHACTVAELITLQADLARVRAERDALLAANAWLFRATDYALNHLKSGITNKGMNDASSK